MLNVPGFPRALWLQEPLCFPQGSANRKTEGKKNGKEGEREEDGVRICLT